MSINNIEQQGNTFLGNKAQSSYTLEEAMNTISNQNVAQSYQCHLCQKESEQRLICKVCSMHYCFSCINKAIIDKDDAIKLFSSSESMNNWACFTCLKESSSKVAIEALKEKKAVVQSDQRICLLCKLVNHPINFDDLVKNRITDEKMKLYLQKGDAITTILQAPSPRILCKNCFNSNPVNEFLKEAPMNLGESSLGLGVSGKSRGRDDGSDSIKNDGLKRNLLETQMSSQLNENADLIITINKEGHNKRNQSFVDNEKKELLKEVTGGNYSNKVVIPTQYNPSLNQPKQPLQSQLRPQQEQALQPQQQSQTQTQQQHPQAHQYSFQDNSNYYPSNDMSYNINDFSGYKNIPPQQMPMNIYSQQPIINIPPHFSFLPMQGQGRPIDSKSMNYVSPNANYPKKENDIDILNQHQDMIEELRRKVTTLCTQTEIHKLFIQYVMRTITMFMERGPSLPQNNNNILMDLKNNLSFLDQNNPTQNPSLNNPNLFGNQSVSPGSFAINEMNPALFMTNQTEKNQGRIKQQQQQQQEETAQSQIQGKESNNKQSLPSSRGSLGPLSQNMPGLGMPQNMGLYPNLQQQQGMNVIQGLPMQPVFNSMGINHPMMPDNNSINHANMIDMMKIMNDPMVRNIQQQQQQSSMMNAFGKMNNIQPQPMGNMIPNMNPYPNHSQMMSQKNQMNMHMLNQLNDNNINMQLPLSLNQQQGQPQQGINNNNIPNNNINNQYDPMAIQMMKNNQKYKEGQEDLMNNKHNDE